VTSGAGRLRKRLATACRTAGLEAAPLLAFERWRFAAKFAEDAAASPSPTHKPRAKCAAAVDPVIPSPPAGADAQLVADLQRSGMPAQVRSLQAASHRFSCISSRLLLCPSRKGPLEVMFPVLLVHV